MVKITPMVTIMVTITPMVTVTFMVTVTPMVTLAYWLPCNSYGFHNGYHNSHDYHNDYHNSNGYHNGYLNSMMVMIMVVQFISLTIKNNWGSGFAGFHYVFGLENIINDFPVNLNIIFNQNDFTSAYYNM